MVWTPSFEHGVTRTPQGGSSDTRHRMRGWIEIHKRSQAMKTRVISGVLTTLLIVPMVVAQVPQGPRLNPPNTESYSPAIQNPYAPAASTIPARLVPKIIPPPPPRLPATVFKPGFQQFLPDMSRSIRPLVRTDEGTRDERAVDPIGGDPLSTNIVIGGGLLDPADLGPPNCDTGQLNYGTGLDSCSSSSCGGCWFATTSGLLMRRSDDDKLWVSFDQGDGSYHLLTTRHAELDLGGGFETRIGYAFCDGIYAVEGVYWGIFPGMQEANGYGANTVGGIATTILGLSNLTYDAGLGQQALTVFFNGAERHRIQRTSEFHNVEMNVLANTCVNPCCDTNLRIGWLAGFRYMRYDDGFTYSTEPNEIPFDGDPEELHYDIGCENNLIGFQVGGRVDYCMTCALSGFIGAKFGVYGNHISHRSVIVGSNGFAIINDVASPFNGRDFNVNSNVNNVSFLGEIDLGLDYQISRCWSATMGYRAVAATGVAHATRQVIRDDTGTDLNWVGDVNKNGSLILHGAFAGLEFCY